MILRILSTIDEADYRNHIAQRDKGGHRLHVLAARTLVYAYIMLTRKFYRLLLSKHR